MNTKRKTPKLTKKTTPASPRTPGPQTEALPGLNLFTGPRMYFSVLIQIFRKADEYVSDQCIL